MSLIASVDEEERYFSDLYICSYTSALIESRSHESPTLDRSSLLLVAQHDASLPGGRGEPQVVQLFNIDIDITSVISEGATPTTVLDGLRNHRFAHFACHGTLETGKPFDASFKLHGEDRLTLLDIVRGRLPATEFAFISACHTVELTDDSIAVEGLHQAAAVQSMFCGTKRPPYCERFAEALRDAVLEPASQERDGSGALG
ncbi:hypothetical protein BC827DRAFT_1157807 [Russula dissimulans]|nr:hypothetical protein BC827DRAFT_1157807 [Russula dissimulans]